MKPNLPDIIKQFLISILNRPEFQCLALDDIQDRTEFYVRAEAILEEELYKILLKERM